MKKVYYTPYVYANPHYIYWPMSYQPHYAVQEHTMMPHKSLRSPQINIKDYGGNPFVVNIEDAAEQNQTFRTALWTGRHLQVTLMSLLPGEDIGLEVHHDVDQFLRLEEGHGIVQMGKSKSNLDFRRNVSEDDAIMVPAGTWHNITNTGNKRLKLYSIYAPPEHPFGTVHRTKADDMN
ncbi:cupin domain-containing protein [Virgibacillus soli]|uniref:Cupin domain-containing protein n=1 Tax=Paracerasibacillus soli TaxID=480284 RepID=A0ABU5CM82_9BACI|nr:cupin domain-containing protein [Virgibacillus soli]MDY0407479.1 cupin domain-containing protein [Virgibacillus soli]